MTTEPVLALDLGETVTSGIPYNGNLVVQNKGNSTIFRSSVNLVSSGLNIQGKILGPLPALSKRSISFEGRNSDLIAASNDQVKVTLNGIDAKGNPVSINNIKKLNFRPLYLFILPIFFGLVAIAVIIYLMMRYWPQLRSRLGSRFPWLLPKQ